MRKKSEKASINRIIDANINRAKEGLRVCEEITRFVLEDRRLSKGIKKIRHQIDKFTNFVFNKQALLEGRDSLKDTGKNIYLNELKRKDIRDIFLANIQRVKESLRVLEEFSKLISTSRAIAFKEMRYQVYELEKEIIAEISALYNLGQRNIGKKAAVKNS